MHMCILHFVALTLESQLLIIDKVKLEPYFNRKPCAEKPVLDGAFVDNLPHKIATTFLLISLKKGLPSWSLTSATRNRYSIVVSEK